MKIALINFDPSYEKLQTTIQYIQNIHDEVINAKIDLYCDDKLLLNNQLKNNTLLNNIFPIKLDNLSIGNIQITYKSIRYYAKLNKYNIAIDTQNTYTSAFFTFIAAGRTAGITNDNINGFLKRKLFYDEYTKFTNTQKESIYKLFAKTFGFEKEYSV